MVPLSFEKSQSLRRRDFGFGLGSSGVALMDLGLGVSFDNLDPFGHHWEIGKPLRS
jgi:hypothetical protein